MPSVSIVAILNAHLSLFGSLKYSFQRKSMLKMYGASGQVTVGYFCHLILVRFTSAFIRVKSCDPSVMLAIETDSAPTGLDGINVH